MAKGVVPAAGLNHAFHASLFAKRLRFCWKKKRLDTRHQSRFLLAFDCSLNGSGLPQLGMMGFGGGGGWGFGSGKWEEEVTKGWMLNE